MRESGSKRCHSCEVPIHVAFDPLCEKLCGSTKFQIGRTSRRSFCFGCPFGRGFFQVYALLIEKKIIHGFLSREPPADTPSSICNFFTASVAALEDEFRKIDRDTKGCFMSRCDHGPIQASRFSAGWICWRWYFWGSPNHIIVQGHASTKIPGLCMNHGMRGRW